MTRERSGTVLDRYDRFVDWWERHELAILRFTIALNFVAIVLGWVRHGF